MKTLKWAAVVVTALFALMNVGAMVATDIDVAWRVVAGVLALAGLAAAVALAANASWARTATIVVGGLNVVVAIVGLFADQDGGVIGIVVGAVAVVLGALLRTESYERVAVVQ